jgi:hypothetical protein
LRSKTPIRGQSSGRLHNVKFSFCISWCITNGTEAEETNSRKLVLCYTILMKKINIKASGSLAKQKHHYSMRWQNTAGKIALILPKFGVCFRSVGTLLNLKRGDTPPEKHCNRNV